MASLEANEITIKNFPAGVLEILELVKGAAFVAIDCTVETTGFLLKDETMNSAYLKDLRWNGDWYEQIKSKQTSHCLLEVGVAVFTQVSGESRRHLQVEAFNIPISPGCVDDSEIAHYRGRKPVHVQVDAFGKEFMSQVNFDLNKVFYLGAPYLNKQLSKQASDYVEKNPGFMQNRRRRRLNPDLIPELFENVGELEREGILTRLQGISKLFQGISSQKVPVVGHNLFLKMIFIFKDFFEYLPDTYPEYFDKLSSLFPAVYDTKLIAEKIAKAGKIDGLNRSQTLYQLLRTLSKATFDQALFSINVGQRSVHYQEEMEDILAGLMLEEEEPSSFCYQAGFDAYSAGLLFSNEICYVLEDAERFENDPSGDDFMNNSRLKPFQNQFYKSPEIPERKSQEFHDFVSEKAEKCKPEGKARESRRNIDTKSLKVLHKWTPGLPQVR